MRPTNITAGAGKLMHDLKALRVRWEQAKLEWDDPVSRDFEAKQLEPLERSVDRALHAIDELQQFLGRMVKDVGPRE